MRMEILFKSFFKNAFFFIVDIFPLITFVVSFLLKKRNTQEHNICS